MVYMLTFGGILMVNVNIWHTWILWEYIKLVATSSLWTNVHIPSPSHPHPISDLLPADALPDDALRLHAPRAVVEVCEGRGHRGVERQQLLLTRLPWRRFIRNVIQQTIYSIVRWNSSRMVHGCCKRMMVAVYDNVYSSLCDSLFCVHQTISQVQRAIGPSSITPLHTR